MVSTAELLPPILKDARGIAFAAAIDKSLDLNPWLACPLNVAHAPDVVLWELAREFGVAGPLYQAMKTRAQKERLVKYALRLQLKRGTPWAVEEVMRLLGFTDARVLDRVRVLLYNGEAVHDGTYNFDAYFEAWSDYKIRLFIDENSRAFTDYDREQAETLAVDWAPLRCRLLGWEIRHIAVTYVDNPLETAESVLHIALMDKALNSQPVERSWIQPLADGASAIRWRLHPDELLLSEVASIALVTRTGVELARLAMPEFQAAPTVVYEGAWTLECAP